MDYIELSTGFGLLLAVNRSKVFAGAIVGSSKVACAKGAPCAGTEDFLLGDVVHAHRDSQHGSHADQIRADMTVA